MKTTGYYFPGPFIRGEDFAGAAKVELSHSFSSGKSAIQFILEKLNLPRGSKVGIPAFCCSSLERAVTDAGLKPWYFDFVDSKSYWANYSASEIIANGIRAIILTHLYGFIHPYTSQLIEICEKNSVEIIHDAAQSYGIDVSGLGNFPVVYSFGPGKSSSAALGGEVMNLKHPYVVHKPSAKQNIFARLYFNSRLFHYPLRKVNARLLSLIGVPVDLKGRFNDMTDFQKKKAREAKWITLNKADERKKRFDCLAAALDENDDLLLTYDNGIGLYYKIVIFAEDHERFKNYLAGNNVPFYCLSADINTRERNDYQLPLFFDNYKKFIEISTERSIPLEEIKRVASVLNNYRLK